MEKLHVCMIIGSINLPNTTGFQTKSAQRTKNSPNFVTTLSLNLHHHMRATPLSISSPSQQLSNSPVWQSSNKNIWPCWIWCKQESDPIITDLWVIKKTADWSLWIALLSRSVGKHPSLLLGSESVGGLFWSPEHWFKKLGLNRASHLFSLALSNLITMNPH